MPLRLVNKREEKYLGMSDLQLHGTLMGNLLLAFPRAFFPMGNTTAAPG